MSFFSAFTRFFVCQRDFSGYLELLASLHENWMSLEILLFCTIKTDKNYWPLFVHAKSYEDGDYGVEKMLSLMDGVKRFVLLSPARPSLEFPPARRWVYGFMTLFRLRWPCRKKIIISLSFSSVEWISKCSDWRRNSLLKTKLDAKNRPPINWYFPWKSKNWFYFTFVHSRRLAALKIDNSSWKNPNW